MEVLIVNGVIELEDLIGSEQVKGDQIGKAKVELPKLKLLIFRKICTFGPPLYLQFRIWSPDNLIHEFDLPVL